VLTLVIQQQGVLQPGSRESAIVQPDDEGHGTFRMAADDGVGHMDTAGRGPLPPTRTPATSPASHSRKLWLRSPLTCSNQTCISSISSVRACKA